MVSIEESGVAWGNRKGTKYDLLKAGIAPCGCDVMRGSVTSTLQIKQNTNV